MIDERQAKVISLVDKKGVTAWDVAQKLFSQVIQDNTQRSLAISESVAHLDYAESEGKIAVEIKSGLEFYRKL